MLWLNNALTTLNNCMQGALDFSREGSGSVTIATTPNLLPFRHRMKKENTNQLLRDVARTLKEGLRFPGWRHAQDKSEKAQTKHKRTRDLSATQSDTEKHSRLHLSQNGLEPSCSVMVHSALFHLFYHNRTPCQSTASSAVPAKVQLLIMHPTIVQLRC